MGTEARATGNLTVKERARGGCVWVAAWTAVDGRRGRKVLGSAWVKDSGRRTARGAIVWRANDGGAPDGALTPKAAQDTLTDFLERERRKGGRRPRQAGETFGEAADAFVAHAASVGGERGEVSPSTLRGYRSLIKVVGVEFPPELALVKITRRRLEEYQSGC